MKKQSRIMSMPVVVQLADSSAQESDIEAVFEYLISVDEQFSPFKHTSELSQINRGDITYETYSLSMREVIDLCDRTYHETDGYFNISCPDGTIDTSGVVKGWAILKAAQLLEDRGYHNYSVEIGGDIQTRGLNEEGKKWRVGIRDPFGTRESVVKVVELPHGGIATSGTYERGAHIYNPHNHADPLVEIVSISVIGPDICEADRFATAAFAMGKRGIHFIANLDGFEGYQIDREGISTETTGFNTYVVAI
jgi:thiamine biosynthesis lipoprotein